MENSMLYQSLCYPLHNWPSSSLMGVGGWELVVREPQEQESSSPSWESCGNPSCNLLPLSALTNQNVIAESFCQSYSQTTSTKKFWEPWTHAPNNRPSTWSLVRVCGLTKKIKKKERNYASKSIVGKNMLVETCLPNTGMSDLEETDQSTSGRLGPPGVCVGHSTAKWS